MNISDRLVELIDSYRREARKCLRGKAYLGATVMEVAAFEAGLQGMCFLYPRQVKRTAVYAKKVKRGFRRKSSKALDFTLTQLIDIADELGWFPTKRATWAGKRTTLAGFAHEIRQVRNYVHPAVWSGDRSKPLKFTKGVHGVVREVIEVANSWLLHRVQKDLLRALSKKKKKKKIPKVAVAIPVP